MKKIMTVFLAIATIFTLVGCGTSKNEVKDVPTKDLLEAVAAKVEVKLVPPFEGENIEEIYGLKASDYDELEIRKSPINVQANEIIIVKAKEGKVDAVKKSLEDHGKAVEQQWATYLPDQHEVTKARIINTMGNYAYLIIDGNAKDLDTIIKDKLKK
ncbi:MAG: DUF4358 domain-containing protein [Clostridium sp.]